jgi:hypothetical protein
MFLKLKANSLYPQVWRRALMSEWSGAPKWPTMKPTLTGTIQKPVASVLYDNIMSARRVVSSEEEVELWNAEKKNSWNGPGQSNNGDSWEDIQRERAEIQSRENWGPDKINWRRAESEKRAREIREGRDWIEPKDKRDYQDYQEYGAHKDEPGYEEMDGRGPNNRKRETWGLKDKQSENRVYKDKGWSGTWGDEGTWGGRPKGTSWGSSENRDTNNRNSDNRSDRNADNRSDRNTENRNDRNTENRDTNNRNIDNRSDRNSENRSDRTWGSFNNRGASDSNSGYPSFQRNQNDWRQSDWGSGRDGNRQKQDWSEDGTAAEIQDETRWEAEGGANQYGAALGRDERILNSDQNSRKWGSDQNARDPRRKWRNDWEGQSEGEDVFNRDVIDMDSREVYEKKAWGPEGGVQRPEPLVYGNRGFGGAKDSGYGKEDTYWKKTWSEDGSGKDIRDQQNSSRDEGRSASRINPYGNPWGNLNEKGASRPQDSDSNRRQERGSTSQEKGGDWWEGTDRQQRDSRGTVGPQRWETEINNRANKFSQEWMGVGTGNKSNSSQNESDSWNRNQSRDQKTKDWDDYQNWNSSDKGIMKYESNDVAIRSGTQKQGAKTWDSNVQGNKKSEDQGNKKWGSQEQGTKKWDAVDYGNNRWDSNNQGNKNWDTNGKSYERWNSNDQGTIRYDSNGQSYKRSEDQSKGQYDSKDQGAKKYGSNDSKGKWDTNNKSDNKSENNKDSKNMETSDTKNKKCEVDKEREEFMKGGIINDDHSKKKNLDQSDGTTKWDFDADNERDAANKTRETKPTTSSTSTNKWDAGSTTSSKTDSAFGKEKTESDKSMTTENKTDTYKSKIKK